jgi:phosphatidylserine/phosphatidylglycerophosphate/cardiolipin synthase-like enzyme/regulation of enolase protein 1 (concanavalin A-like superfamily)
MPHRLPLTAFAVFVTLFAIPPAAAADQLCDSSFENCRNRLLDLIEVETVGIDVAFWFMEDARYSAALIERRRAGVPVRVIMDTRANPIYPGNGPVLAQLRDAGIPMLEKTSGGIVHWKTMIFAGQNVVEFSGANFSSHAFVATDPYRDYLDEVIVFTNDAALVNSFKRKYDDVWITTSGYTPYANLSGTRTRSYPVFAVDPRMNFVPFQNFATRSVGHYNKEAARIDSTMFRITDLHHTNALIAAMTRGVPFRLITDEDEYRDPSKLWNAYNVDKLYQATREICPTTCGVRMEAHLGSLHQKSTLLYGQGMTIFGSSNWTSPSARSQLEHNIFTTSATFFQYFQDQFERKWNNANPVGATETKPFVPSAPHAPSYVSPANAAQGQPLTVTLAWYAGPWAHKYDVHFGTDPSSLALVARDEELGPSENSRDYVRFAVPGLQEGTTYYWQVVSKTMANVARNGPVWSFRTTGSAPAAGDGDVVLYAAKASRTGRWVPVADTTAAGGARIATSDAGVKLGVQAHPSAYFEMSFQAQAGVPYRLWLRGKAERNHWANDSAFVQFSDSITSSGGAVYRIGSTSATTVTIEDCASCGLSGWGWNDNAIGAGALGPEIYFAASGDHRIRVQLREDGLSVDQIVLSRSAFLTTAPGATKNDGTILVEAGGGGGGEPPPPADPLPTGWLSRDIGSVGSDGSASGSGDSFTVRGAGADVWGGADAFHYAYRPLSGDGTITARVSSISGTEAWTKVGVMIRASTASNAAHAFMLVSAGKGLAFQRRTSTGAASTHTSGGAGTAPRWVRLSRAGNVIAAAVSADGASWTPVGSDTVVMPADVVVGLAVSSHNTSVLATGVFESVSVEAGGSVPPPPPPPLPDGWQASDVGAVGAAGSAAESGGVFTVKGAGADVWSTADAFHFAYRAIEGDATITARVASVGGTEAWTKVGVMMRGSLSPQSAHGFMLVSRGKGLAFQRRKADGNVSTHTSGGTGVAPAWVRLVRAGNSITAFVSSDGVSWSVVGSDTFALPSRTLVGLAVSSHESGQLAAGTFDGVTVSEKN